jgi:hypothetical protein
LITALPAPPYRTRPSFRGWSFFCCRFEFEHDGEEIFAVLDLTAQAKARGSTSASVVIVFTLMTNRSDHDFLLVDDLE